MRVAGARVGQKLQNGEGGDRLTRARFADQRHGLAAFEVEGRAADGFDIVFVLEVKTNPQIFDLQQAHVPSFPCVLRGSKASRTASPIKTSSESMVASAKKAVKPKKTATKTKKAAAKPKKKPTANKKKTEAKD